MVVLVFVALQSCTAADWGKGTWWGESDHITQMKARRAAEKVKWEALERQDRERAAKKEADRRALVKSIDLNADFKTLSQAYLKHARAVGKAFRERMKEKLIEIAPWSDNEKAVVRERKVRVGFSKLQVILAWRFPSETSVSITGSTHYEHLHFARGVTKYGTFIPGSRIMLSNGRVATMSQ